MVSSEKQPMILDLGLRLAEKGLIPLPILKLGVRSLIKKRLQDIYSDNESDISANELRSGPIALHTDKANEQHYEIPAEFFYNVLGKRLKYSACYWPEEVDSLEDAEMASLEMICERAKLKDGQSILELGCGWGSLSLYMADKYPTSQILCVSNSKSQADFINSKNRRNIKVVTTDINDFVPIEKFDRVVSI